MHTATSLQPVCQSLVWKETKRIFKLSLGLSLALRYIPYRVRGIFTSVEWFNDFECCTLVWVSSLYNTAYGSGKRGKQARGRNAYAYSRKAVRLRSLRLVLLSKISDSNKYHNKRLNNRVFGLERADYSSSGAARGRESKAREREMLIIPWQTETTPFLSTVNIAAGPFSNSSFFKKRDSVFKKTKTGAS